MKFDGTTYNGKGGDSLGGIATYPYYFDIKNDATGTKTTGVPLLCLSFQDTITQYETWDATVYTLNNDSGYNPGSPGTLTQTDLKADAWIDSQVIQDFKANPTGNATVIEELQWAAWMVGDSSLYNMSKSQLEYQYHLTSGQINTIDGYVTTALGEASTETASFYSGYEIFVPMVGTQSWGNTPQTFMGPVVPEPSSFILFGSGLLTAAGALYRRKRRTA
jgi:hypothetical protein